jgi:hypothetical protein
MAPLGSLPMRVGRLFICWLRVVNDKLASFLSQRPINVKHTRVPNTPLLAESLASDAVYSWATIESEFDQCIGWKFERVITGNVANNGSTDCAIPWLSIFGNHVIFIANGVWANVSLIYFACAR